MAFKKLLLVCSLFWHIAVHAQSISMNVVNLPLVDVLQQLARVMKRNVMVNPALSGMVNLHLQHAHSADIFKLLLHRYGLAALQFGDITYIDSQAALLKFKEQATTWTAWREMRAPRVTKILQIRYSKSQELVKLIKDVHQSLLSQDAMITNDTRTNSIVIRDTQAKIKTIAWMIKQLDIPTPQVLIEARIVSIDQDCEQALGLTFSAEPLGGTEPIKTLERLNVVNQFNFTLAKLGNSAILDVRLKALERMGKAELISTPTLFTSNLQTALIEAGEEVPYQEVSEGGGTAVVFKKAVLGLKVMPQILPKNKVLLHLQINQDRPSHKMVLGVPTISTRKMITHIVAKAGQTIVLGGIFESNHEKGYEGVPYLSRLPLLNFLFKQQNHRVNRRELLIFVTPRLI